MNLYNIKHFAVINNYSTCMHACAIIVYNALHIIILLSCTLSAKEASCFGITDKIV